MTSGHLPLDLTFTCEMGEQPQFVSNIPAPEFITLKDWS